MYTPDNLQQKIHIFEHYPEVMLVHSDISIVDKNWNVTIDSLYQNNKDWIHNALFSWNNIMYNKNTFLLDPTSIISYSIGMIRRESTYAIRSLRDSKNYSVSDREMYLKLLTMYHSYFISSQLVKYRIYNTSISKTKWILGYDMSILLGTLFNEKFWDKKVALWYIAKNFFTNIDIRTLIRRIKIIIYIFFPAKINNLIFKILYWYKE